jgi:hypothetical protein
MQNQLFEAAFGIAKPLVCAGLENSGKRYFQT